MAHRMNWFDLTVALNEEAVRALRSSWRWLLGDDWSPVLFSIWGDAFLKKEGEVYWLNTGTGIITLVASDDDQFRAELTGEKANEWFMPGLVTALHQAGKRPNKDQCFSFTIFPIFAEGKYEVNNVWVSPINEHFGLSGDLHRQISDFPDGQEVRLIIGSQAT